MEKMNWVFGAFVLNMLMDKEITVLITIAANPEICSVGLESATNNDHEDLQVCVCVCVSVTQS